MAAQVVLVYVAQSAHQPPAGGVMSFQVRLLSMNERNVTFAAGDTFQSICPNEIASGFDGSRSGSVVASPSVAYGSVNSWNRVTLCGVAPVKFCVWDRTSGHPPGRSS